MEKNERKKIGEQRYFNENCWLVKNLNYAPYKRCQYCEWKFRNCLFLHYQIISLLLIIFLLALSFLIEEKISRLVIISVFTLVIVYGYFFNKSTNKLIQANFVQRKANEALEERTKELQKRVEELEKFHQLTVGRELKMVELKEEIKKNKSRIRKNAITNFPKHA